MFSAVSVTKPLKLTARYQVLLIIAAILFAYYPAGFGGFCSIDDQDMVNALMNRDEWRLGELFIPKGQGGLYYRPLIGVSFLMDRFLLNTNENLMHLHSLALHVINSLLVYLLAYQLLSEDRRKKSFIPLLSGLFFGLHPINAEAVNWISARPDVLAGTFVLISANFLLLFRQKHSYPLLLLSLFFMILGLLAKEIAMAFLPGALLIMISRDGTANDQTIPATQSANSPFRKNLFVFLLLVGVAAFFLLLRSAAFVSNAEKIRITLSVIFQDVTHTSFVILRALVFYVKKLYLPFPLNFAIIEVDPLYELLIIPLTLLCLVLLSRRTPRSAVFMAGIFLIAPSFLIALNEIAWTPFAERYLYIPSAFVMTGTLLCSEDLMKKRPFSMRTKGILLGLLLAIMGVATFHRSTIWLDNLSLFQDTAKKSPTFHVALSEYGFALMGKGDFQNARAQFIAAKEEYTSRVPFTAAAGFLNNKLSYWDGVDLGLAYLLEREGKTAEAARAFEQIFQKTRGKSSIALEHILYLYGRLLIEEKNSSVVLQTKKKLSKYSRKWCDMNGSPYLLYRLGKVFLNRGDRNEALWYFRKAYERFQDGHEYKIFAQKIIRRLEAS